MTQMTQGKLFRPLCLNGLNFFYAALISTLSIVAFSSVFAQEPETSAVDVSAVAEATEIPALPAESVSTDQTETTENVASTVENNVSTETSAETAETSPLSLPLATTEQQPTENLGGNNETANANQPAEGQPTEPSGSLPITHSPVTVEEVQNGNGLFIFSVFVFVLIVSFLLARILSKRWRLPDYERAYLITLFCFLGGLSSTILGIAGNRMNLGIDLRGGSILVYSVSPNEGNLEDPNASATISNTQMGELKAALARRINPTGVREIAIQELGNNSEVKITIPEADDTEVARLERIINSTGQLKFRILASTSAPEEKELIDRAQSEEYKTAWDIKLPEPIGKDGIIIGGTWVPVDPTQMDSVQSPDLILRESLFNSNDPNAPAPTVDVLVLELEPAYDVQGGHMSTIRESVDEMGRPIVLFSLKPDGAERFGQLTDRYKAGEGRSRGRQLGIVMNDFLYSAPNIKQRISDSGSISFGENLGAKDRERIQRDVRDLINVMNAGVLPAKLSEKPVTSMVTGPTLGSDTIQKGKNAILWGGILVLAFMIAYYGFAGCVASLAVIMNLLLIMTFMLAMRAAFTLPGLAGLVLTVGMAVDANILIFERIKEELNGGATLKMAIRNGFQRAFSAILDSNVTTMITAWILYLVGTDQIKGFAVTLFLGVAFSLFTATFVSRIIFETAERMKFIGKSCVYPIIPGLKPFGKTKINFLGNARPFITTFAIFIILGMIAVFVRGKGIFDIDFVGGIEAQAVFTQEQNIAEIRSKLKDLPDLAVSNLTLSKDRSGNLVAPNTCFTISTSCPVDQNADEYSKVVEEKMKEAFGNSLQYLTLNVQTDYKTEEVPISSDSDKKETNISMDLTVSPAQNHDVVLGYFEDQRDKLIAEKGLETFEIALSGPEYDQGDKDAPYKNWTLTFTTDNVDLIKQIVASVENEINGTPIFESFNTIGSSVASQARIQGLWAIFGSLIFIIAYIWMRFTKVVFGLAAVIALVHNVLFVLGIIALSYWLAPFLGFLQISEFKIGLPTVAAFLTIIGYSLNDTIILFDRLREIRGKNPQITADMINLSINQTLSRTILTTLTTFFVAVVLYFFGGAGIHTFAFAMCVGVFIGTLSTIFIASPSLYWMLNMKKK
ncbi:MAG: protein translocase subunit SecD [Planctomycetia bacterium]|nr:protein translocase subunit SecD [Planctomycetia bacterium]